MSNLIRRFLSIILAITSVCVTLVLMVVGYEVALWLLSGGNTSGQVSMMILAAFPSLFALLALPFWLTLRQLQGRNSTLQSY
jgi:hypothetical protein